MSINCLWKDFPEFIGIKPIIHNNIIGFKSCDISKIIDLEFQYYTVTIDEVSLGMLRSGRFHYHGHRLLQYLYKCKDIYLIIH